MPRVNFAQVEEEMRKLAERRITSIVGDAPMLTKTQTARVWNKSPGWVAKMHAAGRVHFVPFGDREQVSRAFVIIGLIKGI